MAVFAGRLDGVKLTLDLDPGLPPVTADREQMKRVIVNLVDNAAEAMKKSPMRSLLYRHVAIRTRYGGACGRRYGLRRFRHG